MSDCRSTIDSSMHLEPVLASFCHHPASRRIRKNGQCGWKVVWIHGWSWYLIFDDWCSGHRSWVAVVGCEDGRMEGLFARMRYRFSFIVLAKLESGEAMKKLKRSS
ncbi:hypothetical protein BZA77DRAFT_295223 [Pyronema omphalodes]|nr:hypothetical protein BZA77DRAFT_295223 [Pyronema omphalodes]